MKYPVGIQTFEQIREDIEQPLPMIYQSGYLTIKDFDPEDQTYRLDLPNNEVKKGFTVLLAADYLKSKGSPASWLIQAQMALREGTVGDWACEEA